MTQHSSTHLDSMPIYIDATTPWQDGAELQERSASQLIVKHPSEDKYLLLKKLGWETKTYSYVNGGIELGESPVEAARRELAEETGYKHYEPLEEVTGPYIAELYHQRKKHNLRVTMYTFMTQLRDLEQDEVALAEQETNELIWCSPDECRAKVHGEGAKQAFDRLLRRPLV